MPYTPYTTAGRRLMLLCEGRLDMHNAKTATGLLKWCPEDVAAVIDSRTAGQDLDAMFGFGGGIPVVSTVPEAVALGASQLVVGVANLGGFLVPGYREQIIEAIRLGCDADGGLHEILSDDPELAALARQKGVTIWDLRLVPEVSCGMNQAPTVDNKRVLTVGSDCNVGKMFATLSLVDEFRRRGMDAQFAGTGQTGIMISGEGYCIDRAIGDFASGIAERLILDTADHEWVFVEGQGSIDHPSYSGVTLSLLHGTAPQALVLCHVHSRDGRRHDEGSPLLPLAECMRLYETISVPILPAKVVGVSVITRGLNEVQARAELEQIERDLGVPATDPLRFGVEKVADALVAFFEQHGAGSGGGAQG